MSSSVPAGRPQCDHIRGPHTSPPAFYIIHPSSILSGPVPPPCLPPHLPRPREAKSNLEAPPSPHPAILFHPQPNTPSLPRRDGPQVLRRRQLEMRRSLLPPPDCLLFFFSPMVGSSGICSASRSACGFGWRFRGIHEGRKLLVNSIGSRFRSTYGCFFFLSCLGDVCVPPGSRSYLLRSGQEEK
jgi:hypothetical protein